MKNFETELPEGYKLVKTVDAKDKKTVIILNIAALIVAIVSVFILCFAFRSKLKFDFGGEVLPYLIKLFVFIAVMLSYIVLHELVHGLAYKLLTKQKLTFGMTLSVAYCGVPDIYVYRKASVIALVSPLIVFTVVFGSLLFIFNDPLCVFFSIIMFSIHLSGCVGDIYDTMLYLFKFRDKTTLMKDTGPRQDFYIK